MRSRGVGNMFEGICSGRRAIYQAQEFLSFRAFYRGFVSSLTFQLTMFFLLLWYFDPSLTFFSFLLRRSCKVEWL